MDRRENTSRLAEAPAVPPVPWTQRDRRYPGRRTQRMRNRQISTMWIKIRTLGEVPEYHHYQQFRRLRPDKSDSTSTRVRQPLTLGACHPDTAHRGPVHGATREAARSADSARTQRQTQNTLVWLIRPAVTQCFLPRLGVSRKGAHRVHPNLSIRTAPSAHLSCGATRGPVLAKSMA